MRTKLDLIVDFLADRGDGATESIRRELNEPSSEASLFLERLRDRTRGMLDVIPPRQEAPKTQRRGPAILPPPTARKSWVRSPLPLAAAATVLVAVGVAWNDQRGKIRTLEAADARREAEWRELTHKLEVARNEAIEKDRTLKTAASPAPKPAPETAPKRAPDRVPELLVARLEAGLAKLEDRLSNPGPDPPPANPDAPESELEQLRRQVEILKSDLGSRDKSLSKDVKELRASLNQVMMWVRQLANTPNIQYIPVPEFIPVPQGPQNNLGPMNNSTLPQTLDQILRQNNQNGSNNDHSRPSTDK